MLHEEASLMNSLMTVTPELIGTARKGSIPAKLLMSELIQFSDNFVNY